MISTKELCLRAYKRSINEEDKILPKTDDYPLYKKKLCKPYIPRNVEINTRYGEMKVKYKGD